MSVVIVGGHDRMVCQYMKICKNYKDTFVSAKVIFAYIVFIISQTVTFVT